MRGTRLLRHRLQRRRSSARRRRRVGFRLPDALRRSPRAAAPRCTTARPRQRSLVYGKRRPPISFKCRIWPEPQRPLAPRRRHFGLLAVGARRDLGGEAAPPDILRQRWARRIRAASQTLQKQGPRPGLVLQPVRPHLCRGQNRPRRGVGATPRKSQVPRVWPVRAQRRHLDGVAPVPQPPDEI
ncbi:hypothetical protein M885DRAFT_511945 [Pelagophyceae sp. CCMP2097]|nr:hypothetical protein M885DRAFT_511945 [Pelagophyceae sp. CCMP2097]